VSRRALTTLIAATAIGGSVALALSASLQDRYVARAAAVLPYINPGARGQTVTIFQGPVTAGEQQLVVARVAAILDLSRAAVKSALRFSFRPAISLYDFGTAAAPVTLPSTVEVQATWRDRGSAEALSGKAIRVVASLRDRAASRIARAPVPVLLSAADAPAITPQSPRVARDVLLGAIGGLLVGLVLLTTNGLRAVRSE
jgi:hypothetical protein